jgi:hypothetical protein
VPENRSRNRKPNLPKIKTDTETENRKTDYSVRFWFGDQFSVKKLESLAALPRRASGVAYFLE